MSTCVVCYRTSRHLCLYVYVCGMLQDLQTSVSVCLRVWYVTGPPDICVCMSTCVVCCRTFKRLCLYVYVCGMLGDLQTSVSVCLRVWYVAEPSYVCVCMSTCVVCYRTSRHLCLCVYVCGMLQDLQTSVSVCLRVWYVTRPPDICVCISTCVVCCRTFIRVCLYVYVCGMLQVPQVLARHHCAKLLLRSCQLCCKIATSTHNLLRLIVTVCSQSGSQRYDCSLPSSLFHYCKTPHAVRNPFSMWIRTQASITACYTLLCFVLLFANAN